MNERLQTVTLKCPSCGSSLNVSSDIERFACGYCGTGQVVLRRGGTVSLKPVEEAISKVQVSTDRTAAELALVRLQRELAEDEGRWQEWERHFAKRRGSEGNSRVVTLFLILLAMFFGMTGLGLLADGKPELAIGIGSGALGVAALAVARVLMRSQTMKRIEAERKAKWQLFQEHMDSLKAQLAKQRLIVGA